MLTFIYTAFYQALVKITVWYRNTREPPLKPPLITQKSDQSWKLLNFLFVNEISQFFPLFLDLKLLSINYRLFHCKSLLFYTFSYFLKKMLLLPFIKCGEYEELSFSFLLFLLQVVPVRFVSFSLVVSQLYNGNLWWSWCDVCMLM